MDHRFSEFLDDLVGLAFPRATAADRIECVIRRDGGDPRTGIARDAIARPARDGFKEGVLDALLRQLDVVELGDQRTDRAPGFSSERAVDRRSVITWTFQGSGALR
jgi:hypothetical protein